MKRSIPTGAWIAGGLVAAALVMPGVSFATATLEQLVGTNGNTVADVDRAHQLLTAPVSPANLFTVLSSVNTPTSTCQGVNWTPGTKGAIIRDFQYDVYLGSSSDVAQLYVGADCSGSVVAEFNLSPFQTGEISFGDGLPLPAGGVMSLKVIDVSLGTDQVDFFVDGDTVPAGAVPATTHVIKAGPLVIPKSR